MTQQPAPADRRAMLSWCLFDWANSPFPTVVITFVFATYFTSAVAETKEAGTELWGWAMSISGLVLAVSAPIVGAIADQTGRRKPWLAVLTLLCAGSGVALWWVAPDMQMVALALILAGIGNITFELGQVFYNAMLPDLVRPERLGRVSGWGWAMGYAGGLACLAVALFVFVQPEVPPFGLDKGAAEHVRAVGPMVGIWFVLFCLPLFLFTPDRPRTKVSIAGAVRGGLATLGQTLGHLGRYRQIARFLLARMIYIDGVNTLFAFGGIYAAGAFGMEVEEVLMFGIMLNVTAGLGAFGFAWVDDILGPKPTILLTLSLLAVFAAAILLVETKLWFYILGLTIGLFVGPVQSASRSMMARMAPPDMRTEFFGLYALTGRVTAFIGPFLVGTVTAATQSQRLGMATILPFFVIGLLLLLWVRAPRADRAKG